MNYHTPRNKLIRKGDILKSICMEEDGCCTASEESGEPGGDWIYAELISNGHTGSVLSSVGGEYWDSMSYPRDVVYAAGEGRGKADSKCLKLPKIVDSGKFIVASDLPTSTNTGKSKDAFSPNYISKMIGEFERNTGKMSKTRISLMRIFGKR